MSDLHRESEKSDIVRAIEIGIARYWPDIDRIAQAAGVLPQDVHDVVDRLEAIESQPRHEHDCAKHAPGSLECHDQHNCWCRECKAAAQRRTECLDLNQARTVVLRAHTEYVRLRKEGVNPSDMPAWVRNGQHEYDAGIWAKRRDRAS